MTSALAGHNSFIDGNGLASTRQFVAGAAQRQNAFLLHFVSDSFMH